FLGVSLLAHVPEFVLSCLWIGTPPTRLSQQAEQVPTSLLGYVVTGLVTYAVLEQLRGRRPTAGRSLSVGLGKFGPLLGTAIVTWLLTAGLLLLLVVPGVIASVRWILVSPIVVAENAGDPRARSSVLTEGHRGEVFGLLFLLYVGFTIAAVLI